MEIISRAEAKARGLKRYFTGKPCKWGHVAERYLGVRGGGSCIECLGVNAPRNCARSESKNQGLKTYFSGRPCRHGHISKRLISSGECSTCNQIRKKNWRKNNPEKALERDKKYSEKHKEIRCVRSKEYYREHKEELLAKQKQNKDKRNRRTRERYKEDKEFRARNLAQSARYHAEGPINPKGEVKWLRKNKALLRTAKRLLRNLGRSQLQSGESRPTPNLPN